MVLKTHFSPISKSRGFTIVELLVVITVLMLLFSVLVVKVNPLELLKRSRDHTRLSDLSMLDRAVSEYKVDNGLFPDAENTVRISTTLPVGAVDLNKAAAGWISENLTRYLTKLPTDPINDVTYFYSYIHSNDTYELNARMEANFEESQKDGGNDPIVYELGNNLTLLPR